MMNYRFLPCFACLLLFSACAPAPQSASQKLPAATPAAAVAPLPYGNTPPNHPVILQAEQQAAPAARRVMRQTREMTLQGVLIKGACWDYLNAAWNRAGVPSAKRQKVFASRKSGPYANPDSVRPGDWLYFINHSYHNVEHSGMFIAWIDRSAREALIFSYAGERRAEPARYRPYVIDEVYAIMRAQ